MVVRIDVWTEVEKPQPFCNLVSWNLEVLNSESKSQAKAMDFDRENDNS
jgi:hypothetical protein